ncbi:cytochrome d ubiquinol oxidase subunit II [Tsukamurella sp. 8F]|uniref:cytochrome d ubiquinol oxidase subunit II n=1 Tax=unclassified Tsukamurella TaxID=2633480 RepID=UPI0023B8D0FD|nr:MULTISPECIES: cytochrome d ubiquinol oxidase subunit II [unclassified Tsukamurella]MDF0528422.1 cytochrome d ubiquinol oxidase subunit II [Tsukamurella sp. 8J]MDF0586247.1 cytochrome d ubiquinol oxidase subunit II [Tsukamurella sp. 8F]
MTLADYWFLAIGVLFTGYFLLEGFDFGVGMLMPILGRGSDVRRRVLLNTIGPVWDGNEVWLITAGAAMFAAFPEWYATLFSGMYLPLLLILVGLIARVCAIEWRGKIDDPRWRRIADIGIGLGSWIPAILWGVAFANIVRGVDIDAGKQMTTDLWGLLGPYALLGGAALCLLFLLHGTIFVTLKSDGEVRIDAARLARRIAGPVTVVVGGFALWTQLAHGKGWTWAVVAVAALALTLVCALVFGSAFAGEARRELLAFAATSVTVIGVAVLLFGSLFPNVMNATDPAHALTIANASSTHYTLTVMSWCTVFILPVVIGYQAWTYWVFRKRISASHIPPSIGLSPTPPK